MGYTADRITRLEAQLTAIDAALTALEGGVQEYWIGPVRKRFADREALRREREAIEGRLSQLHALQDAGGQSFIRRGAI